MTIRTLYHKFHFIVFPMLLFISLLILYRTIFEDNLKVIDAELLRIAEKQSILQLYSKRLKLEGDLNKIVKMFPDTADLRWLMTNIALITKKEKLEVVSIQPLPIEGGDFYKRLRISLEVEGSYNQVGKMIEDIDNSENYFELNVLNITPVYEKGEGKDGRVKSTTKEGDILLNAKIEIATIVPNL